MEFRDILTDLAEALDNAEQLSYRLSDPDFSCVINGTIAYHSGLCSLLPRFSSRHSPETILNFKNFLRDKYKEYEGKNPVSKRYWWPAGELAPRRNFVKAIQEQLNIQTK